MARGFPAGFRRLRLLRVVVEAVAALGAFMFYGLVFRGFNGVGQPNRPFVRGSVLAVSHSRR